MQWETLNHIILPLFVSNAIPVEKNRDIALSEAHKKVVEYCKETPLARQPNSSYLCRIQIESDCQDRDKVKACDLLTQLKDLEKRARDLQFGLKGNKDHEQFFCHAVGGFLPNEGKSENGYVVPTMTDDLKKDEYEKLSSDSKSKYFQMKELLKKVRTTSYSRHCRQDSDCKVLPVGHKACGGNLSAIYFAGSLPFEVDLKKIDSLGREINQELGYASTCNIETIYGPACRANICQAVNAPY